ncbi:helix-turn-helix domain-containing protein [Salmonella enterica]|nr:helix-turn-helix domain-containing protein [Salmonella enterica]EIK0388776.1 helix-turn-helix domain-containing protein [Salmonella enterica]
MNDSLKERASSRLSQAQIGRLMGVPQQLISRWLSTSRFPAGRVLGFCEVMDWSITPHEVRPDLYPNPTDGIPQKHRNKRRTTPTTSPAGESSEKV